ncbi:MAG: AraC family transcriptional regulator [Flavobacteriaceae bacterium]|jgi:AraC-like DNA-binding protein|nr:AraC family transcriptional regulator [Flavobacteriaceae bacterium]
MSIEQLNQIENGFWVLQYDNTTKEEQQVTREVDVNCIQFHFCFKGKASFFFNNGTYTLPLADEHVLLLYNPQRSLPMQATIAPGTKMISVLISIQKFHGLFSHEAETIAFLNEDNINKKYYQDQIISPAMAVILSQMLQHESDALMGRLYLKAKVYELFSLYFNPEKKSDIAQCPFLADEENVRKIHQAKQIVVEHMSEPPSLQHLADEVGLSLKRLKDGFKQLYGAPVYQFLLDHKMETARKMLSMGTQNVNEVGLKLGYSTSSHFIAAFKKKYGTTPKKYIMSLSS